MATSVVVSNVFHSHPVWPQFSLVGKKQIYLPSAVVRMLRPKPNTSPHYARFQVPLNWGKLDFKDYLYHAYNVEAVRVRSSVRLMKVRRFIKPDGESTLKPTRRWSRPQSKKYMTVFMREPFVWPDEPTDFSPWQKKEFEDGAELRHQAQQDNHPHANRRMPRDANMLREAARKLLSGEERWRPGSKYTGVLPAGKRLWRGDLG